MNKYSLVQLLNREKFGEKNGSKNSIVYTLSGYIKNEKVFLNLSDMNTLTLTKNIISFYEKIQKNDLFAWGIKLPCELYNFCNITSTITRNSVYTYNYYCITCSLYYCKSCIPRHKNHDVKDIYLTRKHIYDNCDICKINTYMPMYIYNDTTASTASSGSTDSIYNKVCKKCKEKYYKGKKSVVYSKPVITKFNLYEWIPINDGTDGYTILQNKNPKSNMYDKKLVVIVYDDYITFNMTTYDNIYKDIIFRSCNKYNVSYDMENVINNYMDQILSSQVRT